MKQSIATVFNKENNFTGHRPSLAHHFLAGAVLMLCILFLPPAVFASGEIRQVQCEVNNPLNNLRENEPVVIRYADLLKLLPGYKGENIIVYDGNKEICSQRDDLDGDGVWDELIFLTDLRPKEKKSFLLQVSPDRKPLECGKEMQAQMFLFNPDKSLNSVTEVSSPVDNMYNKLHHHGPAWESDKIAYRLYFDKKTTVDVYGKKKYRLELEDTKWYPTEKQLEEKYGDDILWVGSSVGVGTLKGWDGEQAVHIDPISKRTGKIVINGNIRTVVDMEVEGWQYQGQTVNVTARYIQYARHRDMIAQAIIGEPVAQGGITLSTGVQKVRQSQTYIEKDGLMALWGTEYPTPDTLKYNRETFGLGVIVPKKNIAKLTEDKVNHLFVIKNNKKPVIEYYVTAASLKEEEGFKTAGEFFAYMQDLKQWVTNPVQVKLKKIK